MTFLRSDAGLQTVERAILLGLVIAGALLIAAAVIGLWVKAKTRLLGGAATWGPSDG
jgi:hypothetical protein